MKKKVKPKGGNGGFDLVAPTFDTAGFRSNFFCDGASASTSKVSLAAARAPDGSPNASFVVPQGMKAPVAINAYGIEVSQNTIAAERTRSSSTASRSTTSRSRRPAAARRS